MSEHRAYCSPLVVGENRLSIEESHHLGTVRRAGEGSTIELFDGAGRLANGTLIRLDRHAAIVRVESIRCRPFELTHRLTVAFAPPKQQRQSYLIEKCTELGVHALWPVVTARGVTKPGASAVEKWRRRAIEASKQSGRAWVPGVEKPQSFSAALGRVKEFESVAICDTNDQVESLGGLFDAAPNDAGVLLLVGPEGGWSQDERRAAREAGLVPVSLGPTTLRVETAAVAGCAMCAAASVRKRS